MSSLAAQLASLLSTVRRPGDFFAAGTTELLIPSLEVEGVGPIALPLLPMQAAQLMAAADVAPYGRGEQTLIDPTVRHCSQIHPDRVRLGGRHWTRTLDGIVAEAVKGLGVSDTVAAEFYKLLIYGPGVFFVGPRATEKADGMFATLVVVLPSTHTGGELVVRHKGREIRLDLRRQDPGEVGFAAFYADCVHELLPVTEGHRLTLVYNLIRRGQGRPPEPPGYEREQARVEALLGRWREGKSRRPGDATPEKLVYLLQHAYTPAQLGFTAPKGADAAAAGVLASAAPQAGCALHTALLTIEESGAAEYAESYGSRRGRWVEEEVEAGEIFDRAVTLSDWRSLGGEAPALGAIPVEDQEISPPDACADLTPDEEHFREATGNEGASFERTYRRAALVLWPRERFAAVLSQAGLSVTLPYLDDLARRWAESGEDRRSPLWREANDLAGHMLARWPRQDWYPRGETPSELGQMLAVLARLDDVAAIERFLVDVIAVNGCGKGDNAAVIGALGRLPPQRRVALIERIIKGTAASQMGTCADLLARAASAWRDLVPTRLRAAAKQLVERLPSGDLARAAPPRPAWQEGTEVTPDLVVALLSGLAAIDESLAQRAVDHVLAQSRSYDPDRVLVAAARTLCAGRARQHSSAIERLRGACLSHLRARVSEPLAPPTDWRRPGKLPCRCPRCTELARFLMTPSSGLGYSGPPKPTG